MNTNIFEDTDGAVIILTWAVLSRTIAGCLHRRALANPNNRLGNMGRDLVREIVRVAYQASIDANYATLFQVFGRRITNWFETLQVPHQRLTLNVLPERIELIRVNGVNGGDEVIFEIVFDLHSDSLNVVMEEEFFTHFINPDIPGNVGLTYNTLHGGAFHGFQRLSDGNFDNPDDEGWHFTREIDFPREIELLHRLIDAAMPDMNRARYPSPYSFSVIARNLRDKHAAAGLIAEIRTGRRGREWALTIGNGKFKVWVVYYGSSMELTLYPTHLFKQNMVEEIEVEGIEVEGIEVEGIDVLSTLTLHHTDAEGEAKHYGFQYAQTATRTTTGDDTSAPRIYSRYELKDMPTDEDSMYDMTSILEAAVKIGSINSTNSTNATNSTRANHSNATCPHCGREVGEGGTIGAACAECARLGQA